VTAPRVVIRPSAASADDGPPPIVALVRPGPGRPGPGGTVPRHVDEGASTEPHAAARAPRSALRRLLTGVAAVLTTFGVLVALLAGYLFGFTALQHARAQHGLLSGLSGKSGLSALSGKIPPQGRPVAILQIPALHLQQVVVAGTSAQDLASGPGLMPGSAPPGVLGNTVIAGRRLLYGQPFAGIGSLRRGDRIRVVSGLGVFNYRVVDTRVVHPGQADPVVPTADARLTLVTSNASLTPTDRVVAVAAMTSQPADIKVAAIGIPPASQLALSGDHGALLPTILWGVALFVGILGTVVLYRRWHKPWPTYLMTTPVLLAVAVLCFQSLAHLLPATM
jgi:sortase A